MEITGLQDATVTWIDRPEQLWPLRAEWQDLAERTGAEVYLRPAWMSAWWDHFGRGRHLACLSIRSEGRLAGLLPFCLERIGIGPVSLRIARLAGTDPHCMIFRLPLEESIAQAGLHLAIRHLTGPLGCTAVSFTPLSDQAAHLPLLQDIGRKDTALLLQDSPEGSHVIFDLPTDFREWMGRLSKKRRGQFQRDARNLQDSCGMQGDDISPDSAAFADFVTFHDRQWQAEGRGGHFADWPGSAAFYCDLADRSSEEPPMRLYRLTGSSGPLATQFALISGGTAHWRLPARTLAPEAERLSIGKIGLVRMIEVLIGQGIRRIEAGRGDYDYKLAYGGESVPVRRLLLSSATGAGRLRLLLGAADLLHLLYYRIWFLKLAPRLGRFGFRPRPLWQVWIRTRL